MKKLIFSTLLATIASFSFAQNVDKIINAKEA